MFDEVQARRYLLNDLIRRMLIQRCPESHSEDLLIDESHNGNTHRAAERAEKEGTSRGDRLILRLHIRNDGYERGGDGHTLRYKSRHTRHINHDILPSRQRGRDRNRDRRQRTHGASDEGKPVEFTDAFDEEAAEEGAEHAGDGGGDEACARLCRREPLRDLEEEREVKDESREPRVAEEILDVAGEEGAVEDDVARCERFDGEACFGVEEYQCEGDCKTEWYQSDGTAPGEGSPAIEAKEDAEDDEDE